MGLLSFVTQTSPVLNIAGAALNLSSAGLAILKPQNQSLPVGINGFLFSIPLTESVTFESLITDHWTQSNMSIQDHVAITPIKITLTGKIGDLVWQKSAVQAYAEQLIARLTSLNALEPELAQQSIEFLAQYNELNRQIEQAKQIINDASTLIGQDIQTSSKQTYGYEQLKHFFYGRTLCTVQTPWETFKNMIIENMTVSQDETTRDVTDVTVTFKQINSIVVTSTKVQLSPKAAAQRNESVNQGQVKGASIAKQAGSIIGGFFK